MYGSLKVSGWRSVRTFVLKIFTTAGPARATASAYDAGLVTAVSR
jgi:hypothetical protein